LNKYENKKEDEMKNILFATMIIFTASSAFAANLISSSKHNLRNSGSSVSKGTSDEICRYCHTPHNPQVNVPLWNRAAGISAYTLYNNTNSTSLNETVTVLPAGSTSRMCLSCHDSNINAQAHDATIAMGAAPSVGNIINEAGGKSLTDDHPIGFVYDAALATADGNLVTPAADGKTVVAGIPLFANGNANEGTLECGSCHAVHGKETALGSGTAIPKLLRFDNAGSALCLKCHNK
jgi:hypothetical protein